MHYYVIANFGNESIGLIHCLYEKGMQDVTVLSVDTGWAGTMWTKRVGQAEAWLATLPFKHIRLQAKPTMADCVNDRKGFPSKKFHWCAGFLKGLAFETYLDTVDPFCEHTIVMAKRKAASRANVSLKEHDTSEHFNDRAVWYPMLDVSNKARDQLIQQAGFDVLPYTSKECLPCIHSEGADFTLLSEDDIARVQQLEKKLGQIMFDEGIKSKVQQAKGDADLTHSLLESYDMGCGSVFGCGE